MYGKDGCAAPMMGNHQPTDAGKSAPAMPMIKGNHMPNTGPGNGTGSMRSGKQGGVVGGTRMVGGAGKGR